MQKCYDSMKEQSKLAKRKTKILLVSWLNEMLILWVMPVIKLHPKLLKTQISSLNHDLLLCEIASDDIVSRKFFFFFLANITCCNLPQIKNLTWLAHEYFYKGNSVILITKKILTISLKVFEQNLIK